MRVAYLGNFGPEHSTENHVARAWEANGHEVRHIQEGEVRAFDVPAAADGADLFLWTQTQGLADTGGTVEERQRMLDTFRFKGIPTVGYHLDRWFGLDREWRVRSEPFFRCDLVVTADGGHQEQFTAAGVKHRWLPPAVSAAECEPGSFRPELTDDVVFVGSWRGGYHAEWEHRPQLIDWLRRTYNGRIGLYPVEGLPAVRGESLRDLYASAKVVVGDSCLVGGATSYWSDRIPETLGRGGFLIHPWVEGIEEHFTDGEHLRLWCLGDWDELHELTERYLADDAERSRIATAGRAHVLANHTYEVRVRQVLDLLCEEGLLCAEERAA